MAFFNLTHLGSQDPFRTASGHLTYHSLPPSQPWTEGRSERREEENGEGREEGEEAGGEAGDTGAAGLSSAGQACPVGKPSHDQPCAEVRKATPPPAVEVSPDCTPAHTTQLYGSTADQDQPWHTGSQARYTEMLRKHKRNPKGPTDLYQQPLTSSQRYGWWMGTGRPEKEPWAQSDRRAHVNSEMTRFVDEMSLTNKEFSLY